MQGNNKLGAEWWTELDANFFVDIFRNTQVNQVQFSCNIIIAYCSSVAEWIEEIGSLTEK